MKDKYLLTAESVTAGHPDKLCDTIADNVLDACLKEDPNARVACEVLATAGKILVAGELRTTASPDVEAIVRQAVQRAGYDCNYHVEVRLHSLAEATPFTAEEVPVSGEGKLRSGFQHFVRPAVQVVFTDLVGADVLASRLVDGHGNLVDVVDIIEKLQAAQRVAFVFTSLSEGLFSLAFTFHWR